MVTDRMSREKTNPIKRYLTGLLNVNTRILRPPQGDVGAGDISGNLEVDSNVIRTRFKNDNLLKTRDIISSGSNPIVGKTFFFDGMSNDDMIASDYIRPIVKYTGERKPIEYIAANIIFGSDVKLTDKMDELIAGILGGNAVFIFEGEKKGLIADTKMLKVRSVSEPENEKVIKGSHEGFIEDLVGNIGLIKKRIQSSDFKAEFVSVGRKTNTQVALCYIDGICDKNLLNDVKNRISAIDIDGVLDSNYIAELISSQSMSSFPMMGTTERPDGAAGKLLEGRIAIIVNGSPEVLTLPYLFIENFQSPEDYYVSNIYASFVRILRIISFFLTVFLPGAFVAILTYHTQIIPIELLLSIIATREGVPFSTVVECALLILVFEIIREAGIRVPSSVSQPLSIVGAIVLGDAAVNARFVSSTMVIIVAMTALCGLMNTRLKSAVIVFRLAILLLGTLLGLYGVILSFLFMCIMILGMESFGVKYTDYSIFESRQNKKDIFIRALWSKMITRPRKISKNKIRQRSGG